MTEKAGDREGAKALRRQAQGEARLLLSEMERRDGSRQVDIYDDGSAQLWLADSREKAGDWEAAEAFLQQAADMGNSRAVIGLTKLRERTMTRERAEALVRQEGRRRVSGPDLLLHARARERVGDRAGAEALLRQGAEQGNTEALVRLALMRERAGDRAGTEALARQAALQRRDIHDLYSLLMITRLLNRLWPNGLDPDGTPTLPWQP
jgi:tetratricopeptide (TPR) repeat protein